MKTASKTEIFKMVPSTSPGALLIGRIDHIWDEWTALSLEITLQVLLTR
jgi:hypothetical protein